ncbi:RIO1 family regulatory kinase/ATPase [Chloroflexota bacterium]
MDSHDNYEVEFVEEQDNLPYVRNMPRQQQRGTKAAQPKRKTRQEIAALINGLVEQDDSQDVFDFTYKASRHERQWIVDSLGLFYEGQWLDDILRLLKGGKEAHVYQCLKNTAAPGVKNDFIAAKVYRPRRFRNLKNDHIYRQGRTALDDSGKAIIDGGMHNAMSKRTSYGLELLHTSWIEHEFQAMKVLSEAGGDVPKPLESGNNAILMTYIGAENMPAPTLNSVRLEPNEARSLFERVLFNVELLLANNLVHGDLSAYNILYWDGCITLIDFPQVIDPHINRNAYSIFERDIRRVCEYFIAQGVKCLPGRLAADLWTAYGHRLGPDIHPGLLDADDEDDRAYWRRLSGAG